MKRKILLSAIAFVVLHAQNIVPNVVRVKFTRKAMSYYVNGRFTHPNIQKLLYAIQSHTVEKSFIGVQPITEKEEYREGKIDLSRWFNIYYSANLNEYEVARNFLGLKDLVEYAHPWYLYEPFYIPNDLDTTAQPFLKVIRCIEAWDLEKGDTTIVVAIVDTGVEYTHPDLIDNLWYHKADPINGIDDDGDGYLDNFVGWDFGGNYAWQNDPDNDPSPSTIIVPGITEHGTKVAGVAVASTDNGTGIASVGFRCQFMPLKVVSDDYPGAIRYGYEAIVYAADHGARIINCSWGGTGYSILGQQVVSYAALNRNALVVAAAGNVSKEVRYYPASYDHVLSVTSIREDGVYAGTTYGYHIDISAPCNGLTTGLNGTYPGTGGYYTSFASPVAAGAAAIVASYFPNHTALQIAEVLRVTADDGIYLLNPDKLHKLGKGRLDLYKALTYEPPAVRIQNKQMFDNNNNIWESGDTIRIFLTLKNYLANTYNLSVRLESTVPFVTPLAPLSIQYGAIVTNQQQTNNTPFLLYIDPAAPKDTLIWIRVVYQDGAYTDWEYFPLLINPTFLDLQGSRLLTTVNNRGNWGYNDYPNNQQGWGLIIDGIRNILTEGGIVIAYKDGRISNNIRSNIYAPNEDFAPLQNIYEVKQPKLANQEIIAYFDDSKAPTPLDLAIKAHYYAFSTAPADRFFIFEYQIYNKKLTFLDSLYFAIFADWYLGAFSFNDFGNSDSALKISYAYDPLENSLYAGIAVLQGPNAPFRAAIINGSDPNIDYSRSSKWSWLTSPPQWKRDTVNVLHLVGVGPFTLLPNDSVKIAFAILIADDSTQLFQLLDTAKTFYHCATREDLMVLDLGNDTSVCRSITLDGTIPGGVVYQWSHGPQQPVVTITQSGSYQLTVVDNQGCVLQDQINIQVVQPPQPLYTITPKKANVGDTIAFFDASQNTTQRLWQFGDGYGSYQDSTYHVYSQAGTYQVQLYLTNAYCDTSIYDTVIIRNVSKALLPEETIKIYPNPVSDKLFIHLPSPQPFEVFLYNIQGKLCLQRRFEKGKGRLEMKNLPSGIYLLRVQYHQRYQMIKLYKR